MRLESSPWTSQSRPIAPDLVPKYIPSVRSIKVNISTFSGWLWDDVAHRAEDMLTLPVNKTMDVTSAACKNNNMIQQVWVWFSPSWCILSRFCTARYQRSPLCGTTQWLPLGLYGFWLKVFFEILYVSIYFSPFPLLIMMWNWMPCMNAK